MREGFFTPVATLESCCLVVGLSWQLHQAIEILPLNFVQCASPRTTTPVFVVDSFEPGCTLLRIFGKSCPFLPNQP